MNSCPEMVARLESKWSLVAGAAVLLCTVGCSEFLVPLEQEGDPEPKFGAYKVTVSPTEWTFAVQSSSTIISSPPFTLTGRSEPPEASGEYIPSWNGYGNGLIMRFVGGNILPRQGHDATAYLTFNAAAYRDRYQSRLVNALLAAGSSWAIEIRPETLPLNLPLSGSCYVQMTPVFQDAPPPRQDKPAGTPHLSALASELFLSPMNQYATNAAVLILYDGPNTEVGVWVTGADAAKFTVGSLGTMTNGEVKSLTITFLGTENFNYYYCTVSVTALNGAYDTIRVRARRSQ